MKIGMKAKMLMILLCNVMTSKVESATTTQLTSVLSKYCVPPNSGTCDTKNQAIYVNGRCECQSCYYFYNISTRKCEPCPLGQYVDNKYSTSCKYPSCPKGTYIKVEKGVDKCPDGTYRISPSKCS